MEACGRAGSRVCLAILASLVILSGVYAKTSLPSLLPTTIDAPRCYARAYDNAHLAKHPDQTVKSMMLMIERLSGRSSDDRYAYDGKLRLTVRGLDKPLWQGLECGWRQGKQTDKRTFECGVECDGGSFQLSESRRSGSLLLILDRLSLSEACGLKETSEAYDLLPGTDDKLFRLDPLPASNCARTFRPMELAEISGAIEYEGRTISDAFCENPRIVEYVLSEAKSGSKDTQLGLPRYRPNIIRFEYAQTKGDSMLRFCAYSFAYKNTFDFGVYAVFFNFEHDPPSLTFRALDSSECVGC